MTRMVSGFFAAASTDPYMGVTHVSLFMAMVERWSKNGLQQPILFKSWELMTLARISSRSTYHRCIRDLHERGYVDYIASSHPAIRSLAYIKWKGIS
jgi:hypothetical protein